MEGEAYVALLRGINVGGRRLSMAKLRSAFLDAGGEGVETYIQSGNVVFRAHPAQASEISARVRDTLNEEAGLDVPMILRSASELADAVANNPFLEREGSERALHLVFMASRPSAQLVSELDPDRSPPDEFVVHGREIYLYLPNGVARSKLTNAYFDARLKTTTTGRNWRTVRKLLSMARGT